MMKDSDLLFLLRMSKIADSSALKRATSVLGGLYTQPIKTFGILTCLTSTNTHSMYSLTNDKSGRSLKS